MFSTLQSLRGGVKYSQLNHRACSELRALLSTGRNQRFHCKLHAGLRAGLWANAGQTCTPCSHFHVLLAAQLTPPGYSTLQAYSISSTVTPLPLQQRCWSSSACTTGRRTEADNRPWRAASALLSKQGWHPADTGLGRASAGISTSQYSENDKSQDTTGKLQRPGTWQRLKWLLYGRPQGSDRQQGEAEQPPPVKVSWWRKRTSVAWAVESALKRTVVRDPDLARLIGQSAAVATWTLVGISALGTLGVDTKPLVTGLGITGFTLGFALKDVATNFISGILLVLQKPFEAGSSVRVQVGSSVVLEGVVASIDLRYVTLRTPDGSSILIPSSVVYANPIAVKPKHPAQRGDPGPAAGKLMQPPPDADPNTAASKPMQSSRGAGEVSEGQHRGRVGAPPAAE